MAAENADAAAEYEQKHVHDVYEDIAGHFSSTRYKVGTEAGSVNVLEVDVRDSRGLSSTSFYANCRLGRSALTLGAEMESI